MIKVASCFPREQEATEQHHQVSGLRLFDNFMCTGSERSQGILLQFRKGGINKVQDNHTPTVSKWFESCRPCTTLRSSKTLPYQSQVKSTLPKKYTELLSQGLGFDFF